MSAFAQRVLDMSRPMASAPSCLWVSLLGAGWVAANLVLITVATQVSYPSTCALIAGVLNGTILSIVAVAKASARFQSGATGLLGGISLSGLRSDGSMIAHAVSTVHEFVHKALNGLEIPGDEVLHDKIAHVTVDMIWMTGFVLMASLIMEWVRDTQRKQEAQDQKQRV